MAHSSNLLPYHKEILKDVHDPATSQLLLVARGLGLRKIVCNLLKMCDAPQSLVLLVNATSDEELGIGEELGLMGCRNPGLRIVAHEMGRKERKELYGKGGLMSVTSRILVVDMLNSDIPIELITGIIVLHAEKVSALSLEAFIIRLYREKNTKGFLKAFSDQPEHITSGLSPLKTVMTELQVRQVLVYPRFHEMVQRSLERRKADVIELFQPMTESMLDIHHAIVQCVTATLGELKRSNSTIELDDFTVENSYFKSFDALVRRQLDPIWHKVGPKTKQLVNDLATLRNLLTYLLSYDAIAFHAYLETILQANTVDSKTGKARQHQSPWLYMDAANIIFISAKRRCYINTDPKKSATATAENPLVVEDDTDEDDDELDALYEAEGFYGRKRRKRRKKWLPDNIEPILEELPKWQLLQDVLLEIEREIIERPAPPSAPGANTVLIMATATRTANDIKEYLSRLDVPADGGTDEAKKGEQGRAMMESRLRGYLAWKAALAKKDKDRLPEAEKAPEQPQLSEAMKLKDKKLHERNASRRRVRGGAAGVVPSTPTRRDTGPNGKLLAGDGLVQERMMNEAEEFASFFSFNSMPGTSRLNPINVQENVIDLDVGEVTVEFDQHYGLITPEQTVLVHTYTDDTDDMLLAETRPRFVIMYEPNPDFVRRIEVYRNSNPGLGVRVYFMMYANSCEEHKYLAGIRKEKESFERLIKERGNMVIPIGDIHARRREVIGRTLSSRNAGGGGAATDKPMQVIVDVREFRSTLPSLLHASGVLVIPATLTVGDYILSPEMCVERKSIPDLYSSFNSGRLYTQCELMSVHYKQPLLLIEFEEHKSFSLEMAADVKAQTNKYMNMSKYPAKKGKADDNEAPPAALIQAKLVLLTLSFPRLRILWSSSPFETAKMFQDLKLLQQEPDPEKAVLVGAEEERVDGETEINAAAEDLLRTFPGITAKNVGHVMSRVESVRKLCEMSLEEVQKLIGAEQGKACYEFLHRRR